MNEEFQARPSVSRRTVVRLGSASALAGLLGFSTLRAASASDDPASVDSVDTADSVDSIDTVDSVDSVDSADTADEPADGGVTDPADPDPISGLVDRSGRKRERGKLGLGKGKGKGKSGGKGKAKPRARA
ncbi:MAG: hypothetical protein ACKOWF_01295 [Chloroflexota bacterium]